jgi:carboxyl-terminal processing protease
MALRCAPAALLVGWPAWAAAETDREACDAWARSPAAWPEVETILRQNYAYIDRVADPDAAFVAAARSAAAARSVAELGTVVETLGYAFRDGHFHVSPTVLPERAWIPTGLDFWVLRAGDSWQVVDVRRDGAAYAAGVRPGWRVVAMDGRPVENLAREALAAIESAPDPATLEYAVNVVLSGRIDEARRIAFHNAGRTEVIDLPSGLDSVTRPDGLLGVTRHGSIARIRFNNSLGENALIAEFDAALAGLGNAEALIVDLRDTPSGGNTTILRAILGHFVDGPAVYQIHRNAFEQAVFGVPRQYAEQVFPRAPRWGRPVAVLAGRWTGSVGEALAMAFDRTAGVPTIGAPLADLLGTLNANRTGNGCLSLSFAWDALIAADGTPREDWQPRILLGAAEMTPDGDDPALAAALALLRETGGR